MAWLSIPSPNPFKALESDASQPSPKPDSCASSPGVKDDLSALGETIGRQFRGVAAFLAPPPAHSTATVPPVRVAEASDSVSLMLLGIRNDLLEIGGSLNQAVGGISKFASNLLFEAGDGGDRAGWDEVEASGDDDGGFGSAAGVNDETLAFVREISERPECWTDFPLSLNCGFHMSSVQKEHSSTILRLVPSFATLKLELCTYMSELQFWMVYFIMLLPKLNGHDLEILSTPEMVEASETLLHKLQSKRVQTDREDKNTVASSAHGNMAWYTHTEISPSQEKEILTDNSNVVKGVAIDEQENEQWLDEDGDVGTSTSANQLYDEIDPLYRRRSSSRADHRNRAPSPVGSGEWVRLKESDLSATQFSFTPDHNYRAPSPLGLSEWVQLKESFETLGVSQKVNPSTSRERDSDSEELNGWLTV